MKIDNSISIAEPINPFIGFRHYNYFDNAIYPKNETSIKEAITKLIEKKILFIIGETDSGKTSFIQCGIFNFLIENNITSLSHLYFSVPLSPFKFYGLTSNNEAERLDSIIEKNKGVIGANPFVFLIDNPTKEFIPELTQQLFKKITSYDVSIYFIITITPNEVSSLSKYHNLNLNDHFYFLPTITENDLYNHINTTSLNYNLKFEQNFIDRIAHKYYNETKSLSIIQLTLYEIQNNFINKTTNAIYNKPLENIHKITDMCFENIYNKLETKHKEDFKKIITYLSIKNERISVKNIAEYTSIEAEQIIFIIDFLLKTNNYFISVLPYSNINIDSEIIFNKKSLKKNCQLLKKWITNEENSITVYQNLFKKAEMYRIGKSALYRPPELHEVMTWYNTVKPTKNWASRHGGNFEYAVLFLKLSENEFENEQVNNKIKHRHKVILNQTFAAICILAATVSTFLFFHGENQRKIAHDQYTFAKKQTIIAKKASQKAIAEEKRARKNEYKAIEQEKFALTQTAIAKLNEKSAIKQKRIAETAKEQAILQNKIAKSALSQVEIEKNKTYHLRLISMAKSMAIKSLTLSNQIQRGLIAKQSYLFNKEHGGNTFDSDIYDALYFSAKLLYKDNFNTLKGHHQNIRALQASPIHNVIYSASSDGKIIQWNISEGIYEPKKIFEKQHMIHKSIAISPDGKYLAVGGEYNHLILFNTSYFDETPIQLVGEVSDTWFLGFTNNGKGIISGGKNKKIFYWIENTSKEIYCGEHKINSIAVNPHQDTFIVGNDIGELILINYTNPQNKSIIYKDEKQNPITSINYNMQGNLLAVSFENGRIDLWDILKNKILFSLHGHNARVNALRFNKESTRLVSGSFDKTVRIWDLTKTSELPIVLKDHQDWVWSIEFSPKGDYILAGCKDNIIRKWHTNLETLANMICPQLDRNLNQKEWDAYIANDIPYEKTCN